MSLTNKTNKPKPEDNLYQSVIKCISKLEADSDKVLSRKFKERLESCDEKIISIRKGTNVEFIQDLKVKSKQRDTSFKSIELNYKYKVSLIEEIHQNEVKLAETEFQNECQALRASLLLEIEDKINKLKEEKENVDVRNGYEVEINSRNHPTTRRNRKRGEQESHKPKKRYNYGPSTVAPLKDDQIQEDLEKMRSNDSLKN